MTKTIRLSILLVAILCLVPGCDDEADGNCRVGYDGDRCLTTSLLQTCPEESQTCPESGDPDYGEFCTSTWTLVNCGPNHQCVNICPDAACDTCSGDECQQIMQQLREQGDYFSAECLPIDYDAPDA